MTSYSEGMQYFFAAGSRPNNHLSSYECIDIMMKLSYYNIQTVSTDLSVYRVHAGYALPLR